MIEHIKLDLALRYYHQGQAELAIEQLKEVLADDPQLAFAHGLLASCLLSQKRIYAAEYEIGIALNIDPTKAYFFLVKSRVAIFNKDFNTALSLCDEALALDPSLSDALLIKAEIYTDLDQRGKTFDALQAAAVLAPDSIDITLAFGKYYFAIGDMPQAEQMAKEALAAHAQDEQANILMGRIYLARGDIDDALYHAKFAISQNPNSAGALRLFTDIKMRNSKFLGLWWRFNTWATRLSNLTGVVVLIGAYLLFNLVSQILSDLGHMQASVVVSYVWLALVVYSWVGVPMYTRALQKELENFRFNPHF